MSAPLPGPWFTGDATALAQAIVAGELSAVQALERTLADVRAIDPHLNALCWCDESLGLERAAGLDAELAACRDDAARAALHRRRPFFGVPLLLKDIGPATAHRQLPSRAGSRLFPDGAPWPVDGTLTLRYLEAGFVPFGRSTSPEMGMSASTEAVAYGGPTRNPWHRGHSAGGSSGGAAAATASGMVSIAHANDGAGSIRIPASACGLIGLKCSRGLMPQGPLAGEGWGGLTTDHVLSRAACATARGRLPPAPAPTPAPRTPRRRWARWTASRRRAAHRAARHLLRRRPRAPRGEGGRAGLCRQLQAWATGWRRHAGLQHHDVVTPVMQGVATGTALFLDQLQQQRGRPVSPTRSSPWSGAPGRPPRRFSATDYLAAVNTFHRLGRQLAAVHERFDVLLTPTLAEPPALLGRFAMHNPDFIDYRLGPQGLWRYTPFCPLANATGAPAISLPAALSRAGLPIGAMLQAAHGQDALLLRLAAQWESARRAPLPMPFRQAAGRAVT
jgi:amidase